MNEAASPTVSVLVNCYNGRAFLREAIQSVIDQTYGDWELVFWDNRSSDGSREIVESFADPRIRVFVSGEHTHLGEARRRAQAHLRGKWIAILDVDDLWYPEKLQRQLELANEAPRPGFVYSRVALLTDQPSDAVGHVFRKYDDRPLPTGDLFGVLVRGNFIATPTLLLNAQAFRSIGGFSGKYPIMEDYYVTLNISRRHRVAAVDEALSAYRLHASNASAVDRVDTFEDLRILRDLVPDPRAMLGMCRIGARHLVKSAKSRRSPDWRRMIRSLSREQARADVRTHGTGR